MHGWAVAFLCFSVVVLSLFLLVWISTVVAGDVTIVLVMQESDEDSFFFMRHFLNIFSRIFKKKTQQSFYTTHPLLCCLASSCFIQCFSASCVAGLTSGQKLTKQNMMQCWSSPCDVWKQSQKLFIRQITLHRYRVWTLGGGMFNRELLQHVTTRGLTRVERRPRSTRY